MPAPDPIRVADRGKAIGLQVIDASLSGLYIHHLKDGVNTFVNAEYTRLTGHSLARLMAMDAAAFMALFHPEDRRRVSDHIDALRKAADGQVLEIEYRFRRADGTWIWCFSRDMVFERDPDGSASNIIGTFLDVTARKQAEESLRESEARFRATFDNAGVGIAHLGLDGRFLRINERFCAITGYGRDALMALRFQDITYPDDLEPSLRRARKLHDVKIQDYSMDNCFVRKDGSPVWVKLTRSLVRTIDGSPDYFIAIVDEISDRRDAQTRTESLATVVETSGDFIGIAQLDGQALYLNRAGQALVGLDGEEAVRATKVEDYLFPEDLPFVRETVLPTVLRDGHWSGDFRFRHFGTGLPIDVHWRVVRIDDPESGRPIQLATATRDIRREKAAEAALLDANRRKDEFLTMLGHELRNPMAPVRNAVEILQALTEERDPKIDWAIAVLDRQTRHLSRLLDDLLDVSRIVRGDLDLRRRPVEVRDVVQQAVDSVHTLMIERGHAFDAKLPPTGVLVDGDPVRLSQILLNLLLNAAKYTQEGGEIQLASETNEGQVIILVRDNGPGIPPERLESLFIPFSRNVRRNQTSSGGLGLGLTISRRLAEMHGGHLKVKTNWPRRGSEFSMYLPRLKESEKPLQAEQTKTADRMCDLPVLVVDDNEDVSAALAMLLQVLGCHVQTAATGADAITLATRCPPRVALLDIGLPDMDGLELARRLRKIFPDNDRMLLVAVTGYGHDEARERSFAAGFDQHLAKPVDLPTLRALLESVSP